MLISKVLFQSVALYTTLYTQLLKVMAEDIFDLPWLQLKHVHKARMAAGSVGQRGLWGISDPSLDKHQEDPQNSQLKCRFDVSVEASNKFQGPYFPRSNTCQA